MVQEKGSCHPRVELGVENDGEFTRAFPMGVQVKLREDNTCV